MKGRIFSVVGGMFLLTVCSKGDRGTVQAAPPAPQPAVSSDPTPAGAAGGTITGKIKFTGTAPRNPAIDMSEEAACKAKYTTTPTEENVVAGPANAPAHVFVYVKSGLPAGETVPAPAPPLVLAPKSRPPPPPPPLGLVGGKLQNKKFHPLLPNIK